MKLVKLFKKQKQQEVNPTKQALGELYDILKDQSRWTKQKFALTKTGIIVMPDAPDAYRFCLVGGIDRVTRYSASYAERGPDQPLYFDVRDKIAEAVGSSLLMKFNDAPDTTHTDVITAIKKAYDAA